MATDQEFAAQLLAARQAGQVDDNTARQLMEERGVQTPIDPLAPPEALQENPPEALAAAVPSSPATAPVQVPQLSPELVQAAQQAQANEVHQNTLQVPQALTGLIPQSIQDANVAVNEIPTAVPQSKVPKEMPQESQNIAPSPEQKAVAEENIVKPVKQEIANHQATQVAASAVQKQLAEQEDNLRKQQEDIQKEIAQKDDSVRFSSLPEILQKGSFGQKLGAVISLALGAFSQGLSGAKTNPVMDFIDKQTELQAAKDKLSKEQKLALKKQLVEIAQNRMTNAEHQSQDEFHKGTIAVENRKLDIEREKILALQQQAAADVATKQSALAAKAGAYRGEAISPEVQQGLGEIEQKSLVNIRGKTYKALNPDAATKLREDLGVRQSAIAKLEPYKALVEKGIWRTLGEKGLQATLKDKGAAETMQQGIVGALRLPYTGPGALNEGERSGLLSAIGKFGLFNLPAVQAEKVKYIMHDLQAEMQREADAAGVKAQVTPSTFVKLENGQYIDKNIYFQQKAEQTGKSVDEIERLYNMSRGNR